MKKLCVVTGFALTITPAFADMSEWEKYCRSETFIVQELQMLRTTVYLDQAQAANEVMHRLKTGEYKKYGVEYDPTGVPYVADTVFYTFDAGIHHLDAAQRHLESCIAAEAGEGDECDGC
jgi:hypothetical protein